MVLGLGHISTRNNQPQGIVIHVRHIDIIGPELLNDVNRSALEERLLIRDIGLLHPLPVLLGAGQC